MPKFTHRLRRFTTAAVLVLAICNTGTNAVDAAVNAQVAEYDLKAALVYRTAKFIEWPASAFAGPNSAFVVCVVGDNISAAAAFRALESKTIGTRAVSVRRITGDMLDLRQCHTAYFPSDAADQIAYVADKLQSAPVLTVGDNKGFVERGGMLSLIMNPERVSFLVALSATKRAQLGVSSQLLQLATVIE
jgi:hypothetical protein